MFTTHSPLRSTFCTKCTNQWFNEHTLCSTRTCIAPTTHMKYWSQILFKSLKSAHEWKLVLVKQVQSYCSILFNAHLLSCICLNVAQFNFEIVCLSPPRLSWWMGENFSWSFLHLICSTLRIVSSYFPVAVFALWVPRVKNLSSLFIKRSGVIFHLTVMLV